MISTLFPDVSREEFVREHFQRAPLARASTAGRLVRRLTWATVERLVPHQPDTLVVRNGSLRQEDPPATFAEALALFREGHSIVLRRCERYDEGLAEVAAAFSKELDGEVVIQVYLTPAGFHSFTWHYDCEDVFIAQTGGTKEYLLRENTVNPAPKLSEMPRDMRYELETTPAMASTLVTGDALYIPRGWWHVARSMEDSLSISVGMLSPDAR
jgi:50S ribosomal protein L16 3-hydroxylase